MYQIPDTDNTVFAHTFVSALFLVHYYSEAVSDVSFLIVLN